MISEVQSGRSSQTVQHGWPRGVPSQYPLATVPGRSFEEQKAFEAVVTSPNKNPCAVCAFNKDVQWGSQKIAAEAIARALRNDYTHRLVCHHNAEIKDGEYVGDEHSDACYGAFHFINAIQRGVKHPMVFDSVEEMMEHHK